MGYYSNAHHGPGVWGLLFMILVLVAMVAGVVVLVRLWQQSRRPGSQPGAPGGPWVDPALAELRMRYARGDIGWDEFSQRLAGLGYPHPAGWGAPGTAVAAGAPPGPDPATQPPVL